MCCSAKTGTLLAAALEIIIAFAYLSWLSLDLTYGQEKSWEVFGSIVIGMNILDLIFAVLLISAVWENKPRRCIPWLSTNYVFNLFSFAVIMRNSIIFSSKAVFICSSMLIVGPKLYFMGIVAAFMKEVSPDSVV